MAHQYIWVNISNGEAGLSVRTKLNDALGLLADHSHDGLDVSYNNAVSGLVATTSQGAIDEVQSNVDTVQANVDTVQTNVDALTATDITYDPSATILVGTDVQAALEQISNISINHMTGGSFPAQALTTTPVKVAWADTVAHEHGTAITGNTALDRFVVNTDGAYKLFGTLAFEAGANNAVSFYLYKNGVALAGPIIHVGRGTGKPVTAVYTTFIDAVATDFFEIYAAGDSAFSADFSSGSVIMERTPYHVA